MITIQLYDCNKTNLALLETYVISYQKQHNLSFQITSIHAIDKLKSCKEQFDIKIVYLDDTLIHFLKIMKQRNPEYFYMNSLTLYLSQRPEARSIVHNHFHSFSFLQIPLNSQELFHQLDDAVNCIKFNRNKVSIKLLTTEKGLIELFIDDILYYEYICKRTIKISTLIADYHINSQISEILFQMKDYHFEMSHRSFIVNLKQIESIYNYNIYLKNGVTIPLSQKRSSIFRKTYNQYRNDSI